jgi:hypothetical protein
VNQDSALASHLDRVSGLHFHTLLHSTILPPHSLNLRDMVSPQNGATWVSLGVDQTTSLPPKGGLNSNPSSYQSDKQGSQVGSWAFLSSFVRTKLTSLVCLKRGFLLLDQHVWCHLAGAALPAGQEHWARDKEVKTPSLNPGQVPRNVALAQTERQGTKTFGKQVY